MLVNLQGNDVALLRSAERIPVGVLVLAGKKKVEARQRGPDVSIRIVPKLPGDSEKTVEPSSRSRNRTDETTYFYT